MYEVKDCIIKSTGVTLLSYYEDSREKLKEWIDKNIVDVIGEDRFFVADVTVNFFFADNTNATPRDIVDADFTIAAKSMVKKVKELATEQCGNHPVIVVDYTNIVDIVKAHYCVNDSATVRENDKLRSRVFSVTEDMVNEFIELHEFFESKEVVVILLDPWHYTVDNPKAMRPSLYCADGMYDANIGFKSIAQFNMFGCKECMKFSKTTAIKK